jgi:hypothetical protein
MRVRQPFLVPRERHYIGVRSREFRKGYAKITRQTDKAHQEASHGLNILYYLTIPDQDIKKSKSIITLINLRKYTGFTRILSNPWRPGLKVTTIQALCR